MHGFWSGPSQHLRPITRITLQLDGVGYYKGNFGNMFFLWDVTFGTAHISRRYPKIYGISHYSGDPWYAQALWPVLKSNVPGSELAADGPMVRIDDDRVAIQKDDALSTPLLSLTD